MENFKSLIKKYQNFDYDSFSLITNIDSRLKIVCIAQSMYNMFFKKSLFEIDVEKTNSTELIFILNIILIILKKQSLVYDFKKFDENIIFRLNVSTPQSNNYKDKIKLLLETNKEHLLKPKFLCDNEICDNEICYNEIDIVLSGGGNAGFYGVGSLDILNNIDIVVNRISGVSVGAWVGFFYYANIDSIEVINLYMQIYDYYNNSEIKLPQLQFMYESWRSCIVNLIDENMYKKCNDKFFIGYTEINSNGAEFKVKSNFTSNEDLYLTCMASAAIPYLSIEGTCIIMDGKKVMDGGLIQHEYFFEDKKYNQLFINHKDISYSPEKLLLPIDDEFDKLLYSGAEDMMTFLKSGYSKHISLIKK